MSGAQAHNDGRAAQSNARIKTRSVPELPKILDAVHSNRSGLLGILAHKRVNGLTVILSHRNVAEFGFILNISLLSVEAPDVVISR